MALYKRPNSKYWWMKFTFDGQLIQQSTQVANKRDALTVESAYRTQLALGKIGIEPKKNAPTFDKAVDDFLVWSKVRHAEARATYKRYFYVCGGLKAYFGKIKVDRIKHADIEKFVGWRSRQISRQTKVFVKSETVNFDLFVLKMIFNRLVEAKILRESPAAKVEQLTEGGNAFHVITDAEQKLYLMACPSLLADVASVMLETGMRCGEVYQLKRQDVHLDKNYLQVAKGKTRSSVQRVHLSDGARKVLSYRMQKLKGENLFPRRDIDGAEPTPSLYESHLKTVRSLGYSFRLYDCRHTFATRALESGVDVLTLSQLLGHANLKMVGRYAHISETRKAEAIKLMNVPVVKKKSKSSLKVVKM